MSQQVELFLNQDSFQYSILGIYYVKKIIENMLKFRNCWVGADYALKIPFSQESIGSSPISGI